jgi:uncharacterized protein
VRCELKDKVVVVTGASRGLGAAIAVGLAKRGATVAMLARTTVSLDRVVEQVRRSGGQGERWSIDLRDWQTVETAFRGILDRWGRIDVLVNAAGAKREGPVEQTTMGDAMEMLAVNYLGALACCRAVIPAMRRQGTGHIVNVSSVLGKRATPGRALYSASKAAMNAMTESLRVELMGTGIGVTLVCPGRLAEPGTVGRRLLAMTPEHAAERIIRAVVKPRREVVLTLAGRGLSALNAFAPGFVDRILHRWRRAERGGGQSGISRESITESDRNGNRRRGVVS